MKKTVKEIYFDDEGMAQVPKYVLEDGTIMCPIHYTFDNGKQMVLHLKKEEVVEILARNSPVVDEHRETPFTDMSVVRDSHSLDESPLVVVDNTSPSNLIIIDNGN